MNFLSGYGFGRTSQEAIVLALLGVAADGWKSIGPIFIVGLYRTRHFVVLLAAAIVWFACFAVAVTAAVGMIGQTRASIVAERDALHSKYETRRGKLQELRARRSQQSIARSSSELEAEIAVVLARPIVVEKRYRGTVNSVSSACTAVTPKTAAACAEIAELRRQKAAAMAFEQMTGEIDQLRAELEELASQGAGALIDPQGDLIVRLSGGFLSRSDVAVVLVMLVVVMIELVSAFGPVVLSEFAASRPVATSVTKDTAGRDKAPGDATHQATDRDRLVRHVFEYMAARVRPAAVGRIGHRALWLDYVSWCADSGGTPTPVGPFTHEFERICETELQGAVRREGDYFVGCSLAV